MSDDPRVTLLVAEIQSLDTISLAERQHLAEDLQLVQAINGSPDPVQQVLKRVLLGGVRNYVSTARSLQQMKTAHADKCPVTQAAKAAGKDVETMLKDMAECRGSTSAVTIPWLNIKVSGEAAKVVSVAIALILLWWGVNYQQDRQFKADVLKQVKTTITEKTNLSQYTPEGGQ